MEKEHYEYVKANDSFGVISTPMNASILDISIQGIAIQTPLNLRVNNRVSINLRNGRSVSQLNASVVWSSLDGRTSMEKGDVPLYRAGLMFINTLSEVGKKAGVFIHSNLEYSLQKRMFQRFKVENNNKISIDMNVDFFVKMIGLEGMLVETKFPLEVDSRYLIQMSLGKTMMRVKAQTAYVKQVDNKPGHELYHLGVHFLDLDKESSALIKDYILYRKSNLDS